MLIGGLSSVVYKGKDSKKEGKNTQYEKRKEKSRNCKIDGEKFKRDGKKQMHQFRIER